ARPAVDEVRPHRLRGFLGKGIPNPAARGNETWGSTRRSGLKDWLCHVAGWLAEGLTHKVALLSVGGAPGAHARYWLGRWVGLQSWAAGFPYGTLIINVSGSFVLGMAAFLFPRVFLDHENWYLFIGVGFCGGYTTFSTFEYETFKLVEDGDWGLALANVLGSVLAGFLAGGVAVRPVRWAFPPL